MLPIIQSKVEGKYCEGCPYQQTGVRRVLPDGSGASGILIVGDSPWMSEVAAGRPFAGASGSWLDNILAKRGLDRGDFLVSNSLWCKPPSLGMNDDPESYPEAQLAQQQCRPYLDDLIQDRKPKVILALGNVALKRLTGHTDIQYNHAYLFQSQYGIPVIPTFHPSGILQANHKYTIAFILALARAVEIANGSFQATKVTLTEDPDPSYIVYPGRGDLSSTLPLMVDIETPKSLAGRNEEEAEDDPSYQIIRMGFSVNAWAGVSFPYEGDYIRRARELVRRARVLICWNKNYDVPRLKANGFDLHPSVEIVDAMWAWHWLYSDLPKALGFAAPFFYAGPSWKHLASQRPAYYNAMDNAVQMGLYQGIKSQLERGKRWDRFWEHCVKVGPIYVRMGEAGVKVDKAAREVFMDAMATEAHSYLLKVQELVPPDLDYKDKVKVLKREPKVSKAKVKPLKARFLSLVRVEKVTVEEPALHKDGSPVTTVEGLNLIKVKSMWVKYNPFNPNSREHLLELMRHLKIKPPKARGEDRESTEAKYLKRKGDKYPIFRACVNYKQRSKLLSTYNWPLDDADRAHTTYGFHPSTWRSSSRNVNLGNIPKRLELAKLFRRLLIADKGCRLIEIDRSAIEAVLVGYWAKSPEYIKLAKAGVHSFLGSHVLGEPIPWEVVRDTPLPELQKLLKVYKKKGGMDYEAWKRCIHGSNYLLSAYGMHDEYEEFFPTEASATKVQRVYFESPAGQAVRAYHKATLEEVHSKHYLDNSFQYRHYFYGPLYKFNKRAKTWEVDHEGDAKRAIAFRPQSDAAAIQREDLLALDNVDWFSKLLRLPTYDSIVVEAPVDYVDRSIELLVAQFSKPIPELMGLTVGFEVKVGSNLASKDDSNPEGMEEVSI